MNQACRSACCNSEVKKRLVKTFIEDKNSKVDFDTLDDDDTRLINVVTAKDTAVPGSEEEGEEEDEEGDQLPIPPQPRTYSPGGDAGSSSEGMLDLTPGQPSVEHDTTPVIGLPGFSPVVVAATSAEGKEDSVIVKQMSLMFETLIKRLELKEEAQTEGIKARELSPKVQAVLDERHFRRLEKLDHDVSKFRGWLFELSTILGQLDKDLAGVVTRLTEEEIYRKFTTENWKEKIDKDIGLDHDSYKKYKAALF